MFPGHVMHVLGQALTSIQAGFLNCWNAERMQAAEQLPRRHSDPIQGQDYYLRVRANVVVNRIAVN